MKKIFRSLPAILFVPLLSACFGPSAISVSNAQNNADYTVSYLFEHDGCRVYRFYDAAGYGPADKPEPRSHHLHEDFVPAVFPDEY